MNECGDGTPNRLQQPRQLMKPSFSSKPKKLRLND